MTSPDTIIGGVSARRIAEIRAREAATFTAARPKTEAALKSGTSAFLDGVPMLWMKDWPQPFPMVVAEAKGASIVDIDGNRLDDFCFGDTGSMFGHSPAPVAKAIREQAERGLTYMLPTLDALEVGHLLQDRFGPFHWQIATTATDANRFSIRVARAVTGRPKILFFAASYHGAVDDAMARNVDGKTVARPGLVGQVVDLAVTSKIVEFNDIPALEAALAEGDVRQRHTGIRCHPRKVRVRWVELRQNGAQLAVDGFGFHGGPFQLWIFLPFAVNTPSIRMTVSFLCHLPHLGQSHSPAPWLGVCRHGGRRGRG